MDKLWVPRHDVFHVHCPICHEEFLDYRSKGDVLAKLRDHTRRAHPETWKNRR